MKRGLIIILVLVTLSSFAYATFHERRGATTLINPSRICPIDATLVNGQCICKDVAKTYVGGKCILQTNKTTIIKKDTNRLQPKIRNVKCQLGYISVRGRCVKLEVPITKPDATLTVATDKQNYCIDDTVLLTSRPQTIKTKYDTPIRISGRVVDEDFKADTQKQGQLDLNQQREQLDRRDYNLVFEKGRLKTVPSKHNGYILQFYESPLIKVNYKDITTTRKKISKEHKKAVSLISKRLKRQPKILGDFKSTFNGIALDITAHEALQIKDLAKEIYPNYEVKAFLYDSVPLINANYVWDLVDNSERTITGKGIIIAVLDTGIDYSHPDLGSCRDDEFLMGDCRKVISGHDFVNKDNDPMDDHGHGTHVAATAAGNGILKGVAPDAKLIGYKILNEEGRSHDNEILLGIERSVDPNQDGDFSDKADIVSMSLGGWGNPDDPGSQAVDTLSEAGVVVVVAAGNEGPGEQTIGSPGTARKAITIGNTDKEDIIRPSSSRGPVVWGGVTLIKPDITAPGTEICAAQWDSAWEELQCLDDEHIAITGTSMATPHVSGTVALLLQKYPFLTPGQIKNILMNTAKDLGYDKNIQGTGRVDALKAINIPVILNPGSMNFFLTSDEPIVDSQFTARNIGNRVGIKVIQDKTINGYTYEDSFFTFSSNSLCLESNSENLINFNADLSILSVGEHTINIIVEAFEDCNFEETPKKLTLPVYVRKGERLDITINSPPNWFASNEEKWLDLYILNKGDEQLYPIINNIKKEDLPLTISYLALSKEFDVIGLFETFYYSGEGETKTLEALKESEIIKGVDLTSSVSESIIIDEADSNVLNINIENLLSEFDLEKTYYASIFIVGNQEINTFLGNEYNDMPLKDKLLPRTWQIATNTENVVNENYEIHLFIEGAEQGTSFFDATKFGYFPMKLAYPFTSNHTIENIKNYVVTYRDVLDGEYGIYTHIYPLISFGYYYYIAKKISKTPATKQYILNGDFDYRLGTYYRSEDKTKSFSSLNNDFSHDLDIFPRPFKQVLDPITSYSFPGIDMLLEDANGNEIYIDSNEGYKEVIKPSGEIFIVERGGDEFLFEHIINSEHDDLIFNEIGEYRLKWDTGNTIKRQKLCTESVLNYDGSDFILVSQQPCEEPVMEEALPKPQLPISEINNKGNLPLKGYLYMGVQKLDRKWENIRTVTEDTRPRTIDADSKLQLAPIWENVESFVPSESGAYRVFAKFSDSNGLIVETKQGRLLNTFEFNVIDCEEQPRLQKQIVGQNRISAVLRKMFTGSIVRFFNSDF